MSTIYVLLTIKSDKQHKKGNNHLVFSNNNLQPLSLANTKRKERDANEKKEEGKKLSLSPETVYHYGLGIAALVPFQVNIEAKTTDLNATKLTTPSLAYSFGL